jgi:hypothetical protein
LSYTGSKVLEEGSFLFHNCLRFYLDKNLRYPVRLSLNDMFTNVQYHVEGKGNISLLGALSLLEDKETFNWVIYGQYVNTLGDVITKIEVVPSEDMKGFVNCKVSKQKLKSGDKFKILFSFKMCKAFEEFLKKPKANVAFGVSGKAQRSGTS